MVSRARTPSTLFAPKLRTTPAEQDARAHGHDRDVEFQVGHRPILGALLAQVDQDRMGLAGHELRQGPLQAIGRTRRRTPARGLEIGEEHDLLLGDRGRIQDAIDGFEGRRQVGALVGDRQVGDLLLDFLQIVGRRPDDDPRRPAHQDDAHGVALARGLDQLGGQRLGLVEPARPARGVAHAQRGVQDEQAVDAAAHDDRPQRLEIRLGHRGDDQQDDQRPHRQEQPLLDADPPLVLLDRRQEEPHRRPRDLAELAPIQQVEQDRDRRRRQPVEQRQVGESQGEDWLDIGHWSAVSGQWSAVSGQWRRLSFGPRPIKRLTWMAGRPAIQAIGHDPVSTDH